MIAKVGGAVAVAVILVLTSSGEGAVRPPHDRVPPTQPTVDVTNTSDLRPLVHFGARDNRTRPSRIRFRCGIDGASLRPCARVYRPDAPLDFGSHVVNAQAFDRAGNGSRLATATFAIGAWDAAADFPAAGQQENPAHDSYGDITWFYLYSVARLHDPTLYRPLPEFHVVGGDNQEWSLGVNADGTIVIPLVGSNLAQRLMIFHPDTDRFAVLGWRSPFSGKVTISAELRFPDPVAQVRSNGILWSIDRGASQLQGALLTPGMEAHATTTIDVTSGQTVYLVIDNNGLSESDTTVGQFSVQAVSG
jgi:hypothetical protein